MKKGRPVDLTKSGGRISHTMPKARIEAPGNQPEADPEPVRMTGPEMSLSAALTSSISGVVTEEKSGLPLTGVQVRWTLPNASDQRRGRRPMELGSAFTDDQGRFLIEARKDSKSDDRLCGSTSGNRSKSYVVLTEPNGKVLGRPVLVNATREELVLHPPTRRVANASKQQLKALTNYLTTNRMMLVRDLAQQVANPLGDSPASQWSVETRASTLRAIFDAVAAEDQQTAEAMDLLYENQFVETDALSSGNLERAVTYFKEISRLQKYVEIVDKVYPWVKQSDRQLYRDYLRGVWVASAQKMYVEVENVSKPAAALLERQLMERFEQDFHTNNDLERPASELLLALLLTILKRGTTRGGFGLKPANIPAQGTQTNDEYLQTLIALSKVSPRELQNRFRVSFARNPGDTTSRLQLNIEALLGLLADTFQSYQEPFPAVPGVVEGRPLIFGPYIGRAPFFLQYEEWLERQRTFFPENIYDIRRNIPNFSAEYRTRMGTEKNFAGNIQFPGNGYFDNDPNERARSGVWMERMFPIVDKVREALGKADAQLHNDARKLLDEAAGLLWQAMVSAPPPKPPTYDSKWMKDKFWWEWTPGVWNDKPDLPKLYSDIRVSLKDRSKLKVTTPQELTSFEMFFDPPYYPDDINAREKGLAKSRTLYIYDAFYLYFVLIPYVRSQILFAQGDFAKAIQALSLLTGYRVGIAETTSAPGYHVASQSLKKFPDFYQESTLPYTSLVGFSEDKSAYAALAPILQEPDPSSLSSFLWYQRLAIAPFEQRFFKLAQGEIMLTYADQLYRNDDPSSVRRARELYKGVVFMHGEDPEITPHFPRNGEAHPGPIAGDIFFWKSYENPAKVSQLSRARLALFQMEQGLNVYGYREDMVPVLRYKPLKQAADTFAASAKSAQTDFLNYMTRYEQALIELWQTQSLVKKAQASSGIASEHAAIAQVDVDKAKEQVAAVEAQIVAKQKEIADKNSFFEQFKDYLGGAKDALSGMVPLAQKVMQGDNTAAGSVSGDQMLAIFGKGMSGGAGGAKEAAASTLGSGAAFAVGYAVFAYASYTSMEAMEDAYAKRDGDLKSLQNAALPAAKAQVRLKERGVTIAKYEGQIAAADLEFANTLFRFQQDRFLNADFWNKLTLFANRLMRRYVELGARTAWLAERALAFEQNHKVEIIKLNYLPIALRGVTGADRLLADLAELEAGRIQGVRLTTPIKHTISLAREFPLEFGQLKKTGHCRFQTREIDLRRAYRGTFAYRIRALTVAGQDTDGPAPRGVLRNGGVSAVSGDNLQYKMLVRFPDALALSEFRLHDDLFVYGLPGETLLQFEGSGFETDWELDFPVDANPKGLRSLADVLITFDMNASYSTAVAVQEAAQAATSSPRSIALAASNNDPKGLSSLKASTGPVRIIFDPTKIALPLQETKRTVTNLFLICVGPTTKKYSARLIISKPARTVSFTIEDGIALSNDGPLLGTAAPLPLNALVGVDLNQPFTLEIERTGVAAELKGLFDVVLSLEYTAKF